MINVALILNLSTLCVSPQYHVVYEYNFSYCQEHLDQQGSIKFVRFMLDKSGISHGWHFWTFPNWTTSNPTSISINWLGSHVISEPTTLQEVFDDPSIWPQNEGEFSISPQVLSNEGAHEGDTVTLQNEGGGDEGVVMLNPFSGNPQELPETLEPNIWWNGWTHRPTKQLIENSLFRCPVLTHNCYQRLNLWKKALHILSFVALQMRHNEFMHQLEDGTANFPSSCAYSASLVDNDTYFYNQAMSQPDHPSSSKP